MFYQLHLLESPAHSINIHFYKVRNRKYYSSKKRNIYKIIKSRPSWDNQFNLSLHKELIKEIIYWKNNIKIIDKRAVKEYKTPSLLVCLAQTRVQLQFTQKKVKQTFVINVFQIKRNLRVPLGENQKLCDFNFIALKIIENKIIFWYTNNYAFSL